MSNRYNNNDDVTDEDAVDTSLDPTSANQIERDYECLCFGKRVINASPRVVLAFIISLLLLGSVIVLIFTVGQVNIFAPILTAIVAFWLPSPLQSSMSRKDAVKEAQILQNNRWMKHAITRYNSAFAPRPPYRMDMEGAQMRQTEQMQPQQEMSTTSGSRDVDVV